MTTVNYQQELQRKKNWSAGALFQPNRFALTNDGILYKTNGAPETVFEGESYLYLHTIPEVKEIHKWTFKGETELKGVIIGPELNKIGDRAFIGSGLQQAYLPYNVSQIGIESFSHCHDLETVVIGTQNHSEKFFNFGRNKIPEFNYETSIKEIPSGCFSNDEHLSSVIIGNGVEKVHDDAFYGCSNLKTIICNPKIKDQVMTALEYAGLKDTTMVVSTVKEYNEYKMNQQVEYYSPKQEEKTQTLTAQTIYKDTKTFTVEELVNNGYAKIQDGQFKMIEQLPDNTDNRLYIDTNKHAPSYRIESFAPDAFVNQNNLNYVGINGDVPVQPSCFKGCSNLNVIEANMPADKIMNCLNEAHDKFYENFANADKSLYADTNNNLSI